MNRVRYFKNFFHKMLDQLSTLKPCIAYQKYNFNNSGLMFS